MTKEYIIEKEYITEEGLTKMKKELENLTNIQRREIAQKLEKAISYGDLSENAEYHEAKEAQRVLEQRILELDNIIKSAKVVSTYNSTQQVQVGSVVLVSHEGEKEKFQIVGSAEANPLEDKYSCSSPLGKALLGQSKGAVVKVKTPDGEKEYKIIEIK